MLGTTAPSPPSAGMGMPRKPGSGPSTHIDETRAMIAAIERELALLQKEKESNSSALKEALARKKGAMGGAAGTAGSGGTAGGGGWGGTGGMGLGGGSSPGTNAGRSGLYSAGTGPLVHATASVTSVQSAGSPLRGIARSAWEQSIIEDELAQPLRVSAEVMRKFTAEEEAAERRLAKECEVHMLQLQRLREKLLQRSQQAERMEGYMRLKQSISQASQEQLGASDSLNAKASLLSVGGRSAAAVTAGLSRLDLLERRIAELESSVAAGSVYSAATGLGVISESIYETDAALPPPEDPTFITQRTPRSPRASGVPDFSASASTAALRGAAATGVAAADAGNAASGFNADTPMGVPILASMTAGTRRGKHTLASPYLSGSGPRQPTASKRAQSSGRPASIASRAGQAPTSSVLPPVAAAPLMGLVFKREPTRGAARDAGRVMYAVQRMIAPLDTVLGQQGSVGLGSSAALQASQAHLGDGADPIETWLATKRSHAMTMPGTLPGSALHAERRPGAGSGVSAVRTQRGMNATLSVLGPGQAAAATRASAQTRSASNGPATRKPAGVAAAIDATRGRAMTKAPPKTGSGAPSAAVRQGARTAVRSSTMAQFTDIRKRFEEKKKDVHSTIGRAQGAPVARAGARPPGADPKSQTMPARSRSQPVRPAPTRTGPSPAASPVRAVAQRAGPSASSSRPVNAGSRLGASTGITSKGAAPSRPANLGVRGRGPSSSPVPPARGGRAPFLSMTSNATGRANSTRR